MAAQARPTVSVPDFKNTVTQPGWWWQSPVAADLASALIHQLQRERNRGVLQLE